MKIQSKGSLHLEAVGSSATAGLLELASLGNEAGLDAVMGVWVASRGAVAKVSNRFTGALGAAEQNGVGSLGSTEGELIKGNALTTIADDVSTSGLSEAQSSNLQSRELQLTRIIGDGTNNDSSQILLALHESRKARDRDRGVVDSRHSQSLDNSASKFRLSSTSNKATI